MVCANRTGRLSMDENSISACQLLFTLIHTDVNVVIRGDAFQPFGLFVFHTNLIIVAKTLHAHGSSEASLTMNVIFQSFSDRFIGRNKLESRKFERKMAWFVPV